MFKARIIKCHPDSSDDLSPESFQFKIFKNSFNLAFLSPLIHRLLSLEDSEKLRIKKDEDTQVEMNNLKNITQLLVKKDEVSQSQINILKSTSEQFIVIPTLVNVASQILLFLAGSQPKVMNDYSNTRFRNSSNTFLDCANAINADMECF